MVLQDFQVHQVHLENQVQMVLLDLVVNQHKVV